MDQTLTEVLSSVMDLTNDTCSLIESEGDTPAPVRDTLNQIRHSLECLRTLLAE